MIDKNFSCLKANEILEKGSNFFLNSSEEFDRCIEHIVQLITDAHLLYTNNSFSSSTFLSIAAIEEVGKVHLGMYIKPSESFIKKDKLRDHKSKLVVGANYTISMGKRIKEAVPINELEEIFGFAYNGHLKLLREKAIYCERDENTLIVSKDINTKDFSKNILLFAIESFDDNLVGYTNYSIEVSKKTDMLFAEITKS